MGREEGYKKNNKNNDDEIKFVRPNWYEYDSDDYDHDCGRYRTFCIIHYVCRQLREDLRHLDEKNNNNKPHKKRKRVDNPTNPYDPWPKRVYTCDRPNSCGMAINEGDIFDVASLLSSSSRDYLINNKRNKFPIKDHLSGKRVLLYIWNLTDDKPMPSKINPDLYEDSKEIYNKRGQFEIVFVALGNNEKVFNQAFSEMPWLAIPHEDQDGRDSIEKMFAIKYSLLVRPVLFDSDGTVLLDNCGTDFRWYGPEGFPFTREKIDQVECADKALRKELFSFEKLPLKKLLGEFVLSGEGKQVRTSDLEDNIVGLHLFRSSLLRDPSTELLLETWKLLKDDPSKKLAIISFNDIDRSLAYLKDKYREKYRGIPWYTLPYDGRRLCRVLALPFDGGIRSDTAGHLTILERERYQPLNYFALDILKIYGIGAFPFTLDRAVEIEKKKKKKHKVKLCKLLSPSTPLHRGCSTRYKECTVSGLSGNRVLLLFATDSCYGAGSFLPALNRIYLEKKGTKDEFEIIYISLDCIESRGPSFHQSIQKMPWLVHSFVPKFAAKLARKIFRCTPYLPAIAAFGSSGYLRAIESNLLFKETWSCEYPYIRDDMDYHISRELKHGYWWDMKKVLHPQLLSSAEE